MVRQLLVLLRRTDDSQLVYKITISTIVPLAPVRLFDEDRWAQQVEARTQPLATDARSP